MVVSAPAPCQRRTNPAAVSKQRLSPGRSRLLETMQALNFGRIEGLAIVAGEPAFDPPPKITREVKFGGENGARPELSLSDFSLKRQAQDLLAELDRIGDGVVDVLVIKHGLPFSMQVAERSSAGAA